uniref:Uncharacterized protein n=1 Tax=viral metagenome TaxID=1070528 RepID=A0A6M3LPQ8_9ZZZZ
MDEIKFEEVGGSIWGATRPKRKLYCNECGKEIEKFNDKGERFCESCSLILPQSEDGRSAKELK